VLLLRAAAAASIISSQARELKAVQSCHSLTKSVAPVLLTKNAFVFIMS